MNNRIQQLRNQSGSGVTIGNMSPSSDYRTPCGDGIMPFPGEIERVDLDNPIYITS